MDYIWKAYRKHMDSKNICLTLPADLLEEIDQAAKTNYSTRSGYIREAILLRLKGEAAIRDEKQKFLEQLKQFDKRD